MQFYTFPRLAKFADTYGSGTYGNNAYACASNDSACLAGSSSSLANTGIAVGMIIGIAAMVLLAAVLVRFWRRPATKKPGAKDDLGKK